MLLGELDPEAIGPAIEFATHYEPTPLADFDALLKLVPAGFSFSEATFVDIGSGMGRIVMLACAHPFKQIVGVEVSPALHEIARENIARFKEAGGRRNRDVRFVCRDARAYALPPGNLLVYMYNPFEGTAFKEFIERLSQHDGDIVLVYHTPTQRAIMEMQSAFSMCGQSGCGVVYRKG